MEYNNVTHIKYSKVHKTDLKYLKISYGLSK